MWQNILASISVVAGEIELLKVLVKGEIVCPRHIPDKHGQFFSCQDLPNSKLFIIFNIFLFAGCCV